MGMDDIGGILFGKSAFLALLMAVGDDLTPLAVAVFLAEAAHYQLTRHFVQRFMLTLRRFLYGGEDGIGKCDIRLARHTVIISGALVHKARHEQTGALLVKKSTNIGFIRPFNTAGEFSSVALAWALVHKSG